MRALLPMILLAAGCATPQLAGVRLDGHVDWVTLRAQQAEHPLRLRLRPLVVNGLPGSDYDARRLGAAFARFLTASLPDEVVTELNAPVDAELDLTLDITARSARTIILDVLFVYPGLGFLPIPHPEWGTARVRLHGTLRRADGRVANVESYAERPFDEVMYAWYRTAPTEEAISEAVTEALALLTRDLGDTLVAWRGPPAPGVVARAAPPAPAGSTTAPPVALAVAPPPDKRAGPPRRVAVLEFHDRAGLRPDEAAYVTDLVRDAALRLPDGGFFVMTRENILELLPPDADLASCEGACEVETGRNIGADFVVTGEIIRFGGSLRVSMKLHDTRSARLLASVKASADALEGLEPEVNTVAGGLFDEVGAR